MSEPDDVEPRNVGAYIGYDQGDQVWTCSVSIIGEEPEHVGSGPDPLAAALAALEHLFAAWFAARYKDHQQPQILREGMGWVGVDKDGRVSRPR